MKMLKINLGKNVSEDFPCSENNYSFNARPTYSVGETHNVVEMVDARRPSCPTSYSFGQTNLSGVMENNIRYTNIGEYTIKSIKKTRGGDFVAHCE